MLPQLGVAVTEAAGRGVDVFSAGQTTIVFGSVAVLLPLFSQEFSVILLCPIFGFLGLVLPQTHTFFTSTNIAICAVVPIAIWLLRQVPIKLSCFESGVITQAVLLMLWACHRRMTSEKGIPHLGTDSMYITELGMVSIVLLGRSHLFLYDD